MAHVSTELLYYDLPDDRPVTAQEFVGIACALWEEGGDGNRTVANWLVAAAEALAAKGEPCDFGSFSRSPWAKSAQKE